ncbi:hypothetical protein T07_13 [Trichinella nelsoni]|uniref:Uncharacterized protein n=1 Tax=Trichinella nelsoni TaxID=6336 RepID=A0A0V0SDK0_9BILA|nr:hypothetical protein T07_13 [Trichinella nelsoni]
MVYKKLCYENSACFEFFKNVAQFGLVAIVFSWHIKLYKLQSSACASDDGWRLREMLNGRVERRQC